MPNPSPDLSAIGDLERNPERSLQFEFVRATENAALACLPRIQRDGIPAFHYMVARFGGTDVRCAAYAT